MSSIPAVSARKPLPPPSAGKAGTKPESRAAKSDAKAAQPAKATKAAAKPTVAPAPAPVASDGGFAAAGGSVVVDIKASDSGYDNRIYWSNDNFVTRHYLGVDNQTGSYDLGPMAAGTRIDFAIVNGVGQEFRTGGAAANADGFAHTQTSAAAGGGRLIGFEDLHGGGDRDFNDAVLQVREQAVASPAPAAVKPEGTKARTKDKASSNRSGLGDGTNPGQGAGRERSPNTGTLNPSHQAAAKAAVVYQQIAQLDAKPGKGASVRVTRS